MDLPETGINELRRSIALFNNCREGFNEQFTVQELFQLADMYRKCGWDFTPDSWTDGQVKDALRGVLPMWDWSEKPTTDLSKSAVSICAEHNCEAVICAHEHRRP